MSTPQSYLPSEFGIFHNAVGLYVVWPGTTTTAAPTDGDARGNFLTLTRTGAGTYTAKTVDGYSRCITATGWVGLGTPAGQWNVCVGTAVKNADNTWTIPFTVFNGASAADIPVGAGNFGTFWALMSRDPLVP
jgi:hypothetical protein